MSKILLLDNYDSFTYNLVQYLEELSLGEITVKKNDEIDLDEIEAFDTIVLSPGPGLPKEAGIMAALLKKYYKTKKILGVCLGHQAIIEAFGGSIKNLDKVYHGVTTKVLQTNNQSLLFEGIPKAYKAGRYHSWSGIIDRMPDTLEVTGVDEHGEVMAIQHVSYPVYGVQYHPESIMTAVGKKILANFLGVSYHMSEKDFALENMTDN